MKPVRGLGEDESWMNLFDCQDELNYTCVKYKVKTRVFTELASVLKVLGVDRDE